MRIRVQHVRRLMDLSTRLGNTRIFADASACLVFFFPLCVYMMECRVASNGGSVQTDEIDMHIARTHTHTYTHTHTPAHTYTHPSVHACSCVPPALPVPLRLTHPDPNASLLLPFARQ
jgi:hypothetical protein